ncbi:hypothetical protein MSPP1_002978 [Malassezia sp. CBS 17886]|nr:hypothetical protein MSPP1_002978 [Malassezia sp. CBS 17886]
MSECDAEGHCMLGSGERIGIAVVICVIVVLFLSAAGVFAMRRHRHDRIDMERHTQGFMMSNGHAPPRGGGFPQPPAPAAACPPGPAQGYAWPPQNFSGAHVQLTPDYIPPGYELPKYEPPAEKPAEEVADADAHKTEWTCELPQTAGGSAPAYEAVEAQSSRAPENGR